jgi:hypothetical protein
MHCKRAIPFVVVAIVAAGTLSAGVVPGRWEKVAAEKPGSKLIITMQSGERIDGFYKGLTGEHLQLAMLDGQERAVRKADVTRIITADKRMGSLTNGFIIGAAVGAAIPLIATAIGVHDDDAGPVAVTTLLVALMGGGIGVGIDAAVQGHITLYQAPRAKPAATP